MYFFLYENRNLIFRQLSLEYNNFPDDFDFHYPRSSGEPPAYTFPRTFVELESTSNFAVKGENSFSRPWSPLRVSCGKR
jgi:hypothetical protein